MSDRDELNRITRLVNLLTPVLVQESTNAWEAGLQNCPGPIMEEEARAVLRAALLKDLYGE